MRLCAARTLAIACYLVALGGAGLFALFVLGNGIALWPDTRLFVAGNATEGVPPRPRNATEGVPYMVDLGWLLLFAVQHSGMARQSFKDAWTRLVPAWMERSLYA